MINDENLLKNEINQRLIELAKGETVSGFARKCGIKQTTMSGYINGNSPPTVESLQKIATACNVTVGWLANGEEPMRPQAEQEVDEVERARPPRNTDRPGEN